MKNKKLIVTLAAAMTIVIALAYSMSQLGGGDSRPGARGAQPSQAPDNKSAGEVKPKRAGGSPGSAPQANNKAAPSNSDMAEVGVVTVKAATYNAKVKGYGEAVATHTLTLSAQVSGQITALSASFKTGAILPRGEVLAYVDSTDYVQALAAAQTSYQDAVVALEEERLQGIQANDEWTRSGLAGQPESALVLREPQLHAAQAALTEAEQDVAVAKRDLAFTEISVPFDALVVARSVQPGSYVQVGTEVASLYSADQAEIAIPLSPSQWAQLPSPAVGEVPGWRVRLTVTTGAQQWDATIARIELHQDEDTRQRRAIAVVDKPLEGQTPLLFGTFLVAEIDGRQLENVWRVPSSAISQKQEVWYVAEKAQVLNKFTPTVLFEYEGFTYISPFADMQEAMIVARPLNNYLVNTRVKPVVEGGNDE